MANDKFYKYYQDLPGWAKGVVIVGALGVTYIVVSTVYKKITSIPDLINQQKKVDQLNKDLNDKKKEGVLPTLSQTQFNNLADQAQNAFTNCRLPIIPCPVYLGSLLCQSNSYKEFRPIAEKLKNDADFLQLQSTFGTRTIQKGWGCGGNIVMNLPTLVLDQLNGYEVEAINKILSKNGISYQF
jgi:hypothetical protein